LRKGSDFFRGGCARLGRTLHKPDCQGYRSAMLFKRQRVLLTLLNALDGAVGNTDFQKLLFLFIQELGEEPSYEFVPYRFGCFSFTSYADKRSLIRKGFLEDNDQCWQLTATGKEAARKRAIQPITASRFCRLNKDLRGDALIAEVYRRYPYYAIRSEIIEKILPDDESRARVTGAAPGKGKPGLATIGYEGKSLERYLNQLLQNGVTVLCDVRKNPLSRKYGFSKKTLAAACAGVGIRYEHLPELGIASESRRELKSQADYDALFAEYKRDTLPLRQQELDRIQQWIKSDEERVALTCYELLPKQCHRRCVADALEPRMGLATMHL